MSNLCTDNRRLLPSLLTFSPEAMALLKRLEGRRLRAYLDSGGKKTIGYGHLMQPGDPEKISQAEAEKLLAVDVQRFEKAVREIVKVPLWQTEYEALVIFAFNIGVEAFRRSTMVKKLKALDYREASLEFGRWVFVNGVKNKGLINRRAAEREWFNTIPF